MLRLVLNIKLSALFTTYHYHMHVWDSSGNTVIVQYNKVLLTMISPMARASGQTLARNLNK